MKSRIAVASLALALFALGSAAICGDGSNAGSPASDQKNGSGEWIDAFSDSTFSARYAFTSTGTTGDGFAGSGEMVLYKKGADHVRVDVTFEFDGALTGTDAGDHATTEMTIIEAPGTSAICFGEPGIFAAFGIGRMNTCLTADDFGESDEFGSFLENLSLDGVDRDDYTEATVNGRDARCYIQPPSPTPTPDPTFESFFDPTETDASSATFTVELTDNGPFGSKACFSREGFLVRITGDDSSGSADAEDLTQSVDDAVFDAPYPFFDPPSLEVRNDSDVQIFVNAYASASGTIFDAFSGEGDFPLANENIDAHSSTVLKGNLFGDPLRVEFGTYELPQWAWSCTWDDAKTHEPLVIENDSSNCPNAQRVPGFDPNDPNAPKPFGGDDPDFPFDGGGIEITVVPDGN